MQPFRILGFPFALLLSSPVRAEDNVGLPQLDMSKFPAQLFWLLITFALFYALMTYIALPRVAHTQRNRKHVITAEIKAAHAASDEAQLAVERVERTLKEARAKAQARIIEMMAEVTETAHERKATQEKELLRRLQKAEADIAVAREAALGALNQTVADLAMTMTEKLIGTKVRVGK